MIDRINNTNILNGDVNIVALSLIKDIRKTSVPSLVVSPMWKWKDGDIESTKE